MSAYFNQRFDEGPDQDEIISYPYVEQSELLFERFSQLRKKFSSLQYTKLMANFTLREQYDLDCYRSFSALRKANSLVPNLFYGAVNWDSLYDETQKFINKVDDPQYNYRSPMYILLVHLFLSRSTRDVPFYERSIKSSELWQHVDTIFSNIPFKLNVPNLVSYSFYVQKRSALAKSLSS